MSLWPIVLSEASKYLQIALSWREGQQEREREREREREGMERGRGGRGEGGGQRTEEGLAGGSECACVWDRAHAALQFVDLALVLQQEELQVPNPKPSLNPKP